MKDPSRSAPLTNQAVLPGKAPWPGNEYSKSGCGRHPSIYLACRRTPNSCDYQPHRGYRHFTGMLVACLVVNSPSAKDLITGIINLGICC
jgi:hypothetical protein